MTIRTRTGAVPTAAPEHTVTVSWRCTCHDQRHEHGFAEIDMREARQFASNLKRNENVQPLTVRVNET